MQLLTDKVDNLYVRSQISDMNGWNYVATFSIANKLGFVVPGCLMISTTETSNNMEKTILISDYTTMYQIHDNFSE